MNTEKCWYDLDVQPLELNKTFVFWPDYEGDNFIRHIKYDCMEDFLLKDSLDKFYDRGIKIRDALLFWKRGYRKDINAHIDVNKNMEDVFCAINIVIGGKNSSMSWYYNLTSADDYLSTVKYTKEKTPYITYPINSLIFIDSKKITNTPTLVRTDIPHSISCEEEDRLCISLRMYNKFSSWEDAVLKFKSLNLLKY